MINFVTMMHMHFNIDKDWIVLGAFVFCLICFVFAGIGRKQRKKERNEPYYAKDAYKITVSSYKNEDGELYWRATTENYETLSFEDETPELAIEGLFEEIEELELKEREKENKNEDVSNA